MSVYSVSSFRVAYNVPPLLVSCEVRNELFSVKEKKFLRNANVNLQQNSQLRETAVIARFYLLVNSDTIFSHPFNAFSKRGYAGSFKSVNSNETQVITSFVPPNVAGGLFASKV